MEALQQLAAVNDGHVVAFAGVSLGRDARAVAVGIGLDVRLKREGPHTSPSAAWKQGVV